MACDGKGSHVSWDGDTALLLVRTIEIDLTCHLCSYWLQRDEEIRLDLETCAMAFRLLRMNGYDVSSGT